MLDKDGPPDDLIFGSKDLNTTKKANKTIEKKVLKETNLEKRIITENTNFDYVTNFDSDEEMCDNTKPSTSDTTDFKTDAKNLNLMDLKTVAMTADRYHASNPLVAAIVNALLIDLELVTASDQDLIVTAMKVHNARVRYRKVNANQHKAKNSKNVDYCGYDGKKTEGRVITDGKKRMKVVDYYTFTNQGIILFYIKLKLSFFKI